MNIDIKDDEHWMKRVIHNDPPTDIEDDAKLICINIPIVKDVRYFVSSMMIIM